jgi:outer membrane protein
MKLRAFWLSVLLVAFMITSPVIGYSAPTNADNIKAAYVNMERVLQSDSSYQTAIQDLQQYRRKLRQRIRTQRKELRKMRKNLKQQGSILSQDQRRKKQQQIMRQMRSLQQRAQQSQLQLQRKKQELLAPVLEKIDPVVREVAEQNGYNVIYSYGRSENPSVLWVSDTINITSKIIERLEQQDG